MSMREKPWVVRKVILMKLRHERTEGIEQEKCLVSSANVVMLHSYAIAIGSILQWMPHLQCYVLIMHSAMVKM